jgi:hypothetical protein
VRVAVTIGARRDGGIGARPQTGLRLTPWRRQAGRANQFAQAVAQVISDEETKKRRRADLTWILTHPSAETLVVRPRPLIESIPVARAPNVTRP